MKSFASSIFKILSLSLAIIANTHFAYAQTASILPNAMTVFLDKNGNPLSSGKVYFYEPGTTTPKQTWKDIGETIPNSQPIDLDDAGRAQIWGDGQYRQQVYDRFNNLQWDRDTASPGSGSSGASIGDGMPVGFIAPWSGVIAPANYQFAYGQALSRTTYPELMAAMTITTSIGCIGGSPIITVTDTANLSVGTVLESVCAAGSPTIVSKTSTTVTLSANATVTIATTGRFFLYGNGDASTTFNVPDLRGYVLGGRCNMGGVDCSVLNSTYFSSNTNNTPSGLGAKGGSQIFTLAKINMPNYALTVTDPGHFHHTSIIPGKNVSTADTPSFLQGATVNGVSYTFDTGTATTGITVNSGGSGAGVTQIQPTFMLNYIIKVTPDINLSPLYGVASIGGMTGAILCGTNVSCVGNTISFNNLAGVTSIQGMTGAITCGAGLTCSGGVMTAGSGSVLQSRALAIFQNLSAFDGIETLGYYKGGDGGGAKFYRNDGAILTYTLTSAGSGCSNGTWTGIKFNGGTGKGAYGTVRTAGGIATNITIQGTNAQGNYYSANDVLTASNVNLSCAVYPTITVNTVGNGPFLDSFVTNYSVTNAGAGCTDGSYTSLTPQNTQINGGGFGNNFALNVQVTGGAIVSTSTPVAGAGYRVGDQLSFVNPNATFQIPGCVTQPIITITSISTPLASFTDASGKAFQIIPNADKINVLQFGAIANYNWLTTDNDATDNGNAFRAALNFAYSGNGQPDGRGYYGATVFVPKGDYLICNGLIVYDYTNFVGASWGGTTLHQCNSDGATSHFITQGSPTSFVGVFASNIWDMAIYGSATGTGSIIYSNNNQSGDAVSRVAIYPNSTTRPCLKYEIGYGGQSMYTVHNSLCVTISGTPAFNFDGNFGVTIDGQTMISSVSTVTEGFKFGDGGTASIGNGVHCEGAVVSCVSVNGGGSSPPQVTIMGLTGPATTNLITISAGTPAGYVTSINSRPSGAPCTVFNQATATCVKTGNQTGATAYP